MNLPHFLLNPSLRYINTQAVKTLTNFFSELFRTFSETEGPYSHFSKALIKYFLGSDQKCSCLVLSEVF